MSLQAAPLVAQPAADLVQRFAAQPDQQFPSRPAGFLSPVVTDVEAQEIEPLREMDDPGLGLGQPQPPYRQPGRDLRLSGMGVCFGLAKDHEVVRTRARGPLSSPRVLYLTPRACSMPWNAMLANRGETTPPTIWQKRHLRTVPAGMGG